MLPLELLLSFSMYRLKIVILDVSHKFQGELHKTPLRKISKAEKEIGKKITSIIVSREK